SLQKRGCQKAHRGALAVPGDDNALFGRQVDLLQSGQRLRPKIQDRTRESRFDLPKGLAIDLPRCRPKSEVIHPIKNPAQEVSFKRRKSPAKNQKDPVVESLDDKPCIDLIGSPGETDGRGSRLDSDLGVTRR